MFQHATKDSVLFQGCQINPSILGSKPSARSNAHFITSKSLSRSVRPTYVCNTGNCRWAKLNSSAAPPPGLVLRARQLHRLRPRLRPRQPLCLQASTEKPRRRLTRRKCSRPNLVTSNMESQLGTLPDRLACPKCSPPGGVDRGACAHASRMHRRRAWRV